jgi:DNA replication protein DnaC
MWKNPRWLIEHLLLRFYSTVDLVKVLERENRDGKAGRLALSLLRMDLVIVDELGYLPFSQAGGALLFHLLSKMYKPTSVVITTNTVTCLILIDFFRKNI